MSFTPANSVAWIEIPATDLDKGIAFYSRVFDYCLTVNDAGPNPIADIHIADMNGGVSGHLYPGKTAIHPGTGPTIHLNVPDTLEAAAARVVEAGGKLVSDPIAIPPGRFQYITDPDGNSIGLFEPAKG